MIQSLLRWECPSIQDTILLIHMYFIAEPRILYTIVNHQSTFKHTLFQRYCMYISLYHLFSKGSTYFYEAQMSKPTCTSFLIISLNLHWFHSIFGFCKYKLFFSSLHLSPTRKHVCSYNKHYKQNSIKTTTVHCRYTDTNDQLCNDIFLQIGTHTRMS